MAEFKVVEIFTSINGEGPRQGQLALFIRMQGCNLKCSYCDTAWANEPGVEFRLMSKEEIVGEVKRSGIRNIMLTGGEPLLCEDIGELLSALTEDHRFRVEVETNGSVDLKPFINMTGGASVDTESSPINTDGNNLPSFNMDYKLPGSGMEQMMRMENLALLTEKDTVKFVVSDMNDLERSRELIDEYGLTGRCRVFFSPVYGRIDPETIVDFMKKNRMNDVNLQLQIHKIIWDSEMRGV